MDEAAYVINLLYETRQEPEIYDFGMHRTSFITLSRGNQKSMF